MLPLLGLLVGIAIGKAINLLESLNEHTDAEYLKEIRDRLLKCKD